MTAVFPRAVVVLMAALACVVWVTPASADGDTEHLVSRPHIELGAISDDGRWVVGTEVSGPNTMTRTVRLIDTTTGSLETLWTITNGDRVVPEISADGRWVTISLGGSIALYDRETDTRTVHRDSSIRSFEDPKISADGRYIVSHGVLRDQGSLINSVVTLFDRHTDTWAWLPGAETDLRWRFEYVQAISDDGNHVAFTSRGPLYVHDRRAGTNRAITGADSDPYPVFMGGGRIAYRELDATLRVSDTTGAAVARWRDYGHPSSISADGRWVGASVWTDAVDVHMVPVVLDVSTGRRLTLAENDSPFSVLVAGDGRSVVFASPDVLASGARSGQVNVYKRSIRPGEFSADPAAVRGTFVDDDGDVFEADIEWLVAAGITRGCNPPDNDRYCSALPVTRGQMASFLVRALGLGEGGESGFTDTGRSVHVDDIERLAAAGITRGCNPPLNDRYCPDQPVTRGQMATFLTRALGLPAGGESDFTDTGRSVHVDDIERLAAAGITRGCNPPINDRYCPAQSVTRGQMAAFLHRAFPGDA